MNQATLQANFFIPNRYVHTASIRVQRTRRFLAQRTPLIS
ncbi:hypothetical protein SynRS9907_01162 [Synechococcus sp. RS9907]|nr:hypothetical protein SynRS9907_01162 [Synechococcus sp. RS9907]